MAMIVVGDSGPGIPLEFLDKIFDPFFRVQQGQRSGPKGLGLGLSIVKTLVELQGGTVQAATRAGGGAEFSFTVPLVPMAPVLASVAESDGRQVLLVGCDGDVQQLLSDRLRASGLSPVVAETVGEALGQLHARPLLGMLAELGVGTSDPVGLVQRVRAFNQRVPILVLCTAASQDQASRAMALGAQATLLKPFDAGELQRLMDYWFRPG